MPSNTCAIITWTLVISLIRRHRCCLTPPAIRSAIRNSKKNNFGASFGGPIQKDKTFFYLVYEGVRERQQDAIQDRTLPPACHILADRNGNFYNDAATPLPPGLVPQFPNGLPANAYYSSTGSPITQTPGTAWFPGPPGTVDPRGNSAPAAELAD